MKTDHTHADINETAALFDVPLAAFSITSALLAEALGYPKGHLPPAAEELITATVAELPRHAAPRAGFRLFETGSVVIDSRALTLGGLQFQTGPIITARLRRSEGAALFAATAGPGIDAWSRELMNEGDLLKGYLVDLIGSEMAEQAADWIERRIAEACATRSWKITNRYSPGYCEWHVSEQHKLFSLLPERFCGITVTPSALMLPIKSVSGIIGTGANVKREDYQCSICDLQDCFRRKTNPASQHTTS